MKKLVLFCILLFSNQIFAQEITEKYYDTLYYSYGLIRPCTIRYIENNTIHFNGTTKKGKAVKATVNVSDLLYYVDYDSNGVLVGKSSHSITHEKDTTKFKYVIVEETVEVPKSHLSINPFSIPMLGLSLDYMHRFTEKKQLAIHIPFKISTVFGNTLYFQTGLGINFIPYNTVKSSLYAGLSSQFYFFEGDYAIGFPITMGFIKNITDLLTVNGYAGIGPYISSQGVYNGIIIPDIHFGIGFKLGERYKITNTRKIKVAK